jgi:hypothetical protein
MRRLLSRFLKIIFNNHTPPTDLTQKILPHYQIGKETYGNPQVITWGSSSTQ